MMAIYTWLYREEFVLSSPKEQHIKELGRLLSFGYELYQFSLMMP